MCCNFGDLKVVQWDMMELTYRWNYLGRWYYLGRCWMRRSFIYFYGRGQKLHIVNFVRHTVWIFHLIIRGCSDYVVFIGVEYDVFGKIKIYVFVSHGLGEIDVLDKVFFVNSDVRSKNMMPFFWFLFRLLTLLWNQMDMIKI